MEIKDLLSYDKDSGIFTWLKRRGSAKKGDHAGMVTWDGYIKIGCLGKTYKAHRLAFLFMDGSIPDCDVDHVDGDRKNNSWSNLRKCNDFENQQNRKLSSHNTSGYTGVVKTSSGWTAVIWAGGNKTHIGSFRSAEAAAIAYAEHKEKLHIFNPVQRDLVADRSAE
ncbi:MAG: HNH endonuclease [Pseudomonas sp.]|nr:HNH endonuclease [Pseudomonas sp.]